MRMRMRKCCFLFRSEKVDVQDDAKSNVQTSFEIFFLYTVPYLDLISTDCQTLLCALKPIGNFKKHMLLDQKNMASVLNTAKVFTPVYRCGEL